MLEIVQLQEIRKEHVYGGPFRRITAGSAFLPCGQRLCRYMVNALDGTT
jgi:hypothetical protein